MVPGIRMGELQGVSRKRQPFLYWSWFSLLGTAVLLFLSTFVFFGEGHPPQLFQYPFLTGGVLLSIAASLIAAHPLVKGFRTGVVEGKQRFVRTKQPMAFWLLQAFYMLVVSMLLALGTLFAWTATRI